MAYLVLLVALGWTMAGCGDDGVSPAGEFLYPVTAAEAPGRLSRWGLYPGAPDLDRARPELIPYAPRFPLWSNGSEKVRHVAVPPDAELPTGDELDAGAFPTGTLFFKTFAFEDSSFPNALRPVETRVMLRLEDGSWDYLSYLWDADGRDARRRDIEAETPVDVLGPGGEELTHVVPSRADCQTCHERSRSVVLGYDALQLGDAPLPNAIRDADELTRSVVGYAVGNCTACHNDETPESFFDLGPAAFLGNVIDQETTTGRLAGAGVRVVPGDPDQSFLFLALSGGDPGRAVPAMPPVGVQLVDEPAVTLFRSWIASLPTE